MIEAGSGPKLDTSSYRIVDGRYSCCLCMYTSLHLSKITTHLRAHRRNSTSESPSPAEASTDVVHSLNLDMEPPTDQDRQDAVSNAVSTHAVTMSVSSASTKTVSRDTMRARAPILCGVLAAPPVTTVSISGAKLAGELVSPPSTEDVVSPTSVSERRQSGDSVSNPGKKNHLTLPTYVIENPTNMDTNKTSDKTNGNASDVDREKSQSPSALPDTNPSSLSALNECNYKHADTVLSVSAESCSPTLNELRKSLNQEVGALLKNVLSKTSDQVSEEKDEKDENDNNEVASVVEDVDEGTMDYSVSTDGDASSQNGLSALPIATVDDAFPIEPTPPENFEVQSPVVPASVIPQELIDSNMQIPAVSSVISLRCRLCNYSATSMKNLSKHYKAHMTARKVCKFCGKAFERPSDLVRHNERHLRDMKLGAPNSGWDANDKAKKSALKNLRCHRCSFSHSDKDVLARHVRTKHNGWYSCALCSESFRFVSSFTLHKIRVHNIPDTNVVDTNNQIEGQGFAYSCRKCWISFPDVSRFSQHMIGFHEESAEAIENRKALGENVNESDITSDLNCPVDTSINANTGLVDSEDSSPPEQRSENPEISPEIRPQTPVPGPYVLRIDTYKHNTLFMTELLKADVGENNELRLETEEVDLTEFKAPAPGVSKVSDCKAIVSTMYKPVPEPSPVKEPEPVRLPPKPTEPVKSLFKPKEYIPWKTFKSKKPLSYQQKRISELTGGYYPNLASRIAKKSRSRFRRINTVKDLPQTNAAKKIRTLGTFHPSPVNSHTETSSSDSNSSIPDLPMRTHLKVEPGATDLTLKISSVYGNCDADGLPLPNMFLGPRSNPEATFQCELCNYCTNTGFKYDQHMQAHKEGRLICKLCRKACIKISDLTRHWITHFPNDSDCVLHCDSCPFTHINKDTMENHMKLHYHVNNTLPSTLTDDEFAKLAGVLTKSAPDEIKHQIHMPSPLKPSTSGVYHSPKKSEKRPVGRPKNQSPKAPRGNAKVECEICLKQVYKIQLQLHMSLHHPLTSKEPTNDDGQWFTCDVCGDGFDSKDTLNLHVKRHSDPRPMGRKAKHKLYMSRRPKFASHLPSVCQICNKKLCNKYYQAIHMKNKHGYKYQCKACDEFFQKNDAYQSHIMECSALLVAKVKKPIKKSVDDVSKSIDQNNSDSDATIIENSTENIGNIDALLGEDAEKDKDAETDIPIDTSTQKVMEEEKDTPIDTTTEKVLEDTTTGKVMEVEKDTPIDTSTQKVMEVEKDIPIDTTTEKVMEKESPTNGTTEAESVTPVSQEESHNKTNTSKENPSNSKPGKTQNSVPDWDDETNEEEFVEETTGHDDSFEMDDYAVLANDK